MGNIFENIAKSDFVLALKKIFHHHLQFWKIFMADLCFFVIFYISSVYLDIFLTGNQALNFGVFLIYLAIMFCLYCAAKSFVIQKICLIVQDGKSKVYLKEFFLANIVIGVIFLAVFSAINFILYNVLMEGPRAIIGLIVFIVFFAIFYAYLNIAHSHFFNSKEKKNALVDAFRIMKNNSVGILKIYAIDILLFLIFTGIFSLIGISAKNILMDSPNVYQASSYYNLIFALAAMFFIYLVHYYNRVLFFMKAGR